jgi:predicted TIM-barrel fold metal-dependent hydrolase
LKEFAPDGVISELRRLNYDTANATSPPTMTALTKLVPASQIIYGTDYPYFGWGQFQDLKEAGFSPAELEAIGSGNATRLIPRLRG